MKKNGFTLIELLAVIVLLSLLMFIVFPSIINSVRNYSKKTDKLVLTMLENAADLYIDDNSNEFYKESDSKYCISINELIENDYLKSHIEYNGEDITHSKSMQVTYKDGFNYELVDNNMCADYRNVCTPVTEETKTTGNVPSGEYNDGDEYICEVSPGVSYTFFVISKDDTSVNLIMNRNICEDGTVATEANPCYVAWRSTETYACDDESSCYLNDKGPVTAMDYIYNATKDWLNIPNIKMDYEDENCHYATGEKGTLGYGGIKTTDNITRITKKDGSSVYVLVNKAGYRNLKARMIKYSEIGEYSSEGSNLYLYDYLEGEIQQSLIQGISGYWTLSTDFNSNNDAVIISSSGITSDLCDELYGVRPVISIPKKHIKN